MTTLQQTIESLAKEKGIEPEVIISAIEDAVLTASRKYYKTNENLRTKFNPERGQVELYAVKHLVQEVADPATELVRYRAGDLDVTYTVPPGEVARLQRELPGQWLLPYLNRLADLLWVLARVR